MPVYAETKEPTTFDRVVEPGLDADIARQLKEDQVLDTEDLVASSTAPTTPSSTTSSSSSSNDNNDMVVNEKPDTDSASSVAVDVAPTPSSPSSPSSAASSEQHVIIFDWDDTLLASSFLASQGYRLDLDMEKRDNYEFVKSELKLLENCVVSILEEALQRGKVHIITNAETGWVELSAQKFLPGVVPYLSKITVVSARSTYEHVYPDSPVKWKYCAMYERLSVIMNDDCRKNIISFGDSHVEREAVRTVTRGLSNARTKSIKFAECPNTEQLRKQLELVANCFHYIFTHEGDLDLMLKMSMVPTTPAAASESDSNKK